MKVKSLNQLEMHPRFLQLHDPFAPKVIKDDGTEGDYIRPMDKEHLMVGPDNKPLGFMIVPYKSRQMREAALQRQRTLMRAKPDELADPAFKMNLDIDLVAASIVGWSHDDVFGPYTPERAKEIIGDGSRSFLSNQIETFIVEEKNFFGV